MQWNIGFHVNLKYIICTACFPVLQLQNIRLVLSSMYRAEITTDPICSGFPFFKKLFVFCVHCITHSGKQNMFTNGVL